MPTWPLAPVIASLSSNATPPLVVLRFAIRDDLANRASLLGHFHEQALRSREIWLQALGESGLPYLPTGSRHAVYRDVKLP